MNKFKVGDKIRIKDEVSSETHYLRFPHFTNTMDKLKDKVLTISGFTSREYIEVEDSGYKLHPEWVTHAERVPEDDFAQILRQLSGELTDLSEWLDDDSDSILEEAQEILEGERDSDYGDPVANFNRISRIASSILDYTISPEECVVVMMAVKLSREQYKHKRDNLVDLVAYTEIYNRVKEQNN